MSFQITISPKRRVAARHINDVRRVILEALAEEARDRGMTQSEVARLLEVHRSAINRELRGRKDMSLGRVGEYAWALNRVPVFSMPPRQASSRDNVPASVTISSGGASSIETTAVDVSTPTTTANVKSKVLIGIDDAF